MPRVVESQVLLAWFDSCRDTWPETDYKFVNQYRDDNVFTKALETAYLLNQVNSGAVLMVTAIIFMLEIPIEEAPSAHRSLLRQLYMLKETSDLSKAQERTKETLRKMLLAIVEDVHALVIILAYQVVVMRHVKNKSEDMRREAAKQTRDVFAPLANRLGLSRFKWELEDGILRYLNPEAYRELSGVLAEKRMDRELYIKNVIQEIEVMIQHENIKGVVTGRVKHIYSIWKKMTEKGRNFDELFDVRAVRIIVETLPDCYKVLGVIHEKWAPISKEFDDYIANPKPNGYQSLHTAVLGPANKTLEVQIRTQKMHDHAELGVAAHWHYKESDASLSQQVKLNRVRQLLEHEEHKEATREVLDKDIFGEKVYVLTPAREAIELVAGATPLDFAYQIHTNLGHRCRGAKVNGRIVPLTYVLNNGDEIEILTGKQAMPSRDWLSPHLAYVKSNRTRAKIRTWFKQQAQEKNMLAGKQLLERELSRLNLHLSNDELLKIANRLNCNSLNELYAGLGAGDVTINQFLVRLPAMHQESEFKPDSLIRPKSKSSGSKGIYVRGVGNLLVNIAPCCKPAPPELIGGFVTLNRGVSIHRVTCANFLNMVEQHPERRIDVDWGVDTDERVMSDIFIKAHQHHDLLKDIGMLISNEQLRIVDMSMSFDAEGLANLKFTLELTHLDQLSRLIDRVDQMPYVVEARRI